MTRPNPGNRAARLALAGIVAAVLARLALIVAGSGRFDDPDNYLPLARSLASGEGLALNGRLTAYRPPLYPILLAPIVALVPADRVGWGVAALHLALGAATVLMAAASARRWGLGWVPTLLASAIVAFDPVLALQARSVMTETPAAFLVALTLLAATAPGRSGPALAGVAFGLATLCRPSLLPGAGLAAVALLLTGPGSWRGRLARTAILAGATALTLSPWAIRNAWAVGEPVWTTTHGGYTLALANNPVYYREVLDGPPGAVWSGPGQAAWQRDIGKVGEGLPEPEADRRIGATAWRLFRDRPRTFARASLARLGRFWAVAPSPSVYPGRLRLAVATWTIPFWAALIAGMVRGRPWRWPEAVAPAVVLALTAVHLLYWTDLRMRAPIVPALALIAARSLGPRRKPCSKCRPDTMMSVVPSNPPPET